MEAVDHSFRQIERERGGSSVIANELPQGNLNLELGVEDTD